ncbi:unnamed protein product [Pelagomonas calceolata]|uniref:JmjC domain-containing protein n=2 Tax=Pelagomonas calceolata TaxID=35677 RepID=A0A8J2SDH0_9STRA|nr:unnamed protein product [Pelagomonas calceolata]
MDEASLAQFRAATAPSRRVANLRHVRDCVIKRDADPYLRPAEVLALLEPERLGAIELYAAEDPEPQIRKSRTIPRIKTIEFRSYMDRNEPCLIEGIGRDWGLREYVTEGVPDLAKLAETYGRVQVPVQDAGVAKMMPLSQFARVWREKIAEGRRYYLKDWHFRLDGLGHLAPVPEIFADDWLSGARDMDYHFVYLGAAGTRTKLHCDVVNSFSWSANVCGSKRWRFLPAAETSLLRDVFGEDVASSFGPSSSEYPRRGKARPIEVVQQPGEAIFVPSGWYHDVENLNDCLSVNCNWANASNLLWCGPRLVDEANAAPGEVSTSHFLRRVAARAASTQSPRDLAAAAAAARALEGREGDAAVALAAAADARRAALVDSDSDSGEDFLGRVGADLFEDDETPRRRPTRRGWTPGFHDVVDRGVTSFEADVGGRRVCCRLGYRESGTGSSVWDGAVVLARFLETHPSLVRGKRVLELGAGTGFGGLCAAALGASNVTLTDIEACLPLLRENAAGVDGVVVEALDWTEPVAPSQRADVLLAADCLLPGREGLFAPLATTLAALLAGDAVAYFVYEQRCMDCGPFFELLRGAGVAVSCIPDDDLHPEYRAPEIRVLELRRT